MAGRAPKIRLLGLDPGLQKTGWGVIDLEGSRLRHVANGVIASNSRLQISARLVELHRGLLEVLDKFAPDEAAVEQTFVNKNPESTLNLGLARGVVLLVPALGGLSVTEYAPNRFKKSVVGAGHADKKQVQLMVSKLLPGADLENADAADALAVAICHAHYTQSHIKGRASGAKVPRSRTGTAMQRAIAAALAREAAE